MVKAFSRSCRDMNVHTMKFLPLTSLKPNEEGETKHDLTLQDIHNTGEI